MASNSHVEIPEPDDYGPKEVYAFFGLASYYAQILEIGILTMVVAFRCKELHITRGEFDALYAEYNKKTLGQLLMRARKSISIPNDIDTLLGEALLRRNWLIHHYFADRSAQFNTEIGRQQMLSELQSIIRVFGEADHAIEPIYTPVLEEFGVNEERVKKIIEEMIQEHLSKEITDEGSVLNLL
ncbi:MAG TPA: hypothetical protein VN455_09460 [Methanotrichaceae archaeon]|nr:hypothetical protein [Methanotrichaceae archaeon]